MRLTIRANRQRLVRVNLAIRAKWKMSLHYFHLHFSRHCTHTETGTARSSFLHNFPLTRKKMSELLLSSENNSPIFLSENYWGCFNFYYKNHPSNLSVLLMLTHWKGAYTHCDISVNFCLLLILLASSYNLMYFKAYLFQVLFYWSSAYVLL